MKRDLTPELPRGGVGQPIGHDSATLHVTGRANYTDDLPELRGTLYAAVGQSARPLVIAALWARDPRPCLVVVSGEEAADRAASRP